jgi:FSR family fosmidomycin resistance protein-like MFS transporter
MRLLRQPAFLAVAFTHFIVDVLNSQVGLLLAAFSLSLGLRNTAVGLIGTTYSLTGSLSQPLFGWLADRYGRRWAVAGGTLWMGIFFSLVALTPGYWPIAFLFLGALGSGAFHPSGAAQAVQAGQKHMAGRAATAASIFFLFGQGGLTLGPAIGGALLDQLGRAGVLLLAVLAGPIAAFAAWHLPAVRPARPPAARPSEAPAPERVDVVTLILLILLTGMPAWAQSATATFGPKFFQDQGLTPTLYGLIMAAFMGGSAVGGVLGGVLGDRWGQRRTVTMMLALSITPFYFFPLARGLWVYPLVLVAGLFNGAPHSILITMAQKLMPGRMSLASGLILGFTFGVGALGTFLSGRAADQFGLMEALQINAAVSLTGMVLSLALKRERTVAQTISAIAD